MNGYRLLLSGVLGRLAGALALSAIVWLAYAWATAPIVVS